MCYAYRDVRVRLVEAFHHLCDVCECFEAWCERHNVGREVGVSGVVKGVNLEGVSLAEGLYRSEDEGDRGCFVGDKVDLDTLSLAC